MTAIEIQASKEAERKGRLSASDTKAWKPLSSQIWTRALLRSQPTWWEKNHTHLHVSSMHYFQTSTNKYKQPEGEIKDQN